MNPPLIDFHTHILPGVDHGSLGISDTEHQLEIIASAGVDTVVATSHFYPNAISVGTFLEQVDAAVERILTKKRNPLPRIALGAEVLYCEGLEQMDGLDRLCIRGTNVLLLELPMSEWNASLFQSVDRLCKHYTVVLAHIDRYVSRQKPELEELLSIGAYAQINASSLSSFLLRRRLASFFESDRVVALGSDLHGTAPKSYRPFKEAKSHLGSTHQDIMQRTQLLLTNAQYFS